MDESEITAFFELAGEGLATQTILTALCSRLAAIDGAHRTAVAAAFDDAASQIESVAIKVGKAARPEQIIKAGRVVEHIRTVALGD